MNILLVFSESCVHMSIFGFRKNFSSCCFFILFGGTTSVSRVATIHFLWTWSRLVRARKIDFNHSTMFVIVKENYFSVSENEACLVFAANIDSAGTNQN